MFKKYFVSSNQKKIDRLFRADQADDGFFDAITREPYPNIPLCAAAIFIQRLEVKGQWLSLAEHAHHHRGEHGHQVAGFAIVEAAHLANHVNNATLIAAEQMLEDTGAIGCAGMLLRYLGVLYPNLSIC